MSLNHRNFGIAVVSLLLLSFPLFAQQSDSNPADAPPVFPLEDVRPGMRAQVRTVFAGNEIEEFELEVIGVLRNLIGPRQDMILVRLLGEKPEYTGVVAGMSGSPVYIDGKLVGALSFRLGSFTREPIGGVTPFGNMMRAADATPRPETSSAPAATASLAVPGEQAQTLGLPGSGTRYLVPIETPISFVGAHPEAMRRFASEFSQMGLLATQGGGDASPENLSPLEPGGAVSAALVTGDVSIAATCTITARVGDRLYACGHPVLGSGDVSVPMARAEIVTTVASELNSFKISNLGDLVGTFSHDRRSAIVGTVGAVPHMIPVDLSIHHGGRKFDYHYQVFEHPKFSPTLMNFTLFNGLYSTIESGEGFSYRVRGRLSVRGHEEVVLDDMFGPTDGFFPDAFFVASDTARAFEQVFGNTFETPVIEGVTLEVELLPERLTATVEHAWAGQGEAFPGDTLMVKAVLRPYRGERVVLEMPVKIPEQAERGPLRILVSDASMLDRITRVLSGGGFGGFLTRSPRVNSLDQLIALLNQERRNDRLYVTLFQNAPTMMVEDKILPSVPLSQLNVLTRQQAQGANTIFFNSILSEDSEPLNQVVSGSQWLQIMVR